MSKISRFHIKGRMISHVTIDEDVDQNDLAIDNLDNIFYTHRIKFFYIGIHTFSEKSMANIQLLFDYSVAFDPDDKTIDVSVLNLGRVEIKEVEIGPRVANTKIFDVISFLNDYDYKGEIKIREPDFIVDLNESLQIFPPNLKKITFLRLPENVPDMHDMAHTILSIHFGAGSEAVDFLEKNIEKIRYLELMFCLLEPPQRFCDIISKSNLRHLKLISAGDANYYDEFYYNTLFASYDFKIMLAKAVRQNTSLVDVKIKEYH